MSTEQKEKKEQLKCKYCNVFGVEWFKKDDGKFALRWKGDKQLHTREECNSIKEREEGFSFYDVINKHKGSASNGTVSSEQEQKAKQEVPQKQEVLNMDEFVKALYENTTSIKLLTTLTTNLSVSIATLAKSSEELKIDMYKGITQLGNSIIDMKEKFSNIPGFDENLSKNVDQAFKKGSEITRPNMEDEEIQEAV